MLAVFKIVITSLVLILFSGSKYLNSKEKMFGIFKKKTEKEKLQSAYEKLMKESFELSTVNRSKSDDKAAEADLIMKKIEALE